MNLSTTGLSLAADAAIDLQLHTNLSDGLWLPEQLLDYLVGEQFGLVALTDHDRVDTAVSLQKLALNKQIPVLVATEMTCEWRGSITDILCFGFDPQDKVLNQLTQDLLHRQQGNAREAYENLQRKGYLPHEPPGGLTAVLAKPSAQQPHHLFALIQSQHEGMDDATTWQIMVDSGSRLMTNEVAAVVEAVQQSGGVCLIAHPGRQDGFVTYDDQLLDEIRREVPLDGLEVYYPAHTPEQTSLYLDYAQRHDWLISAGSDSHSPDKPPVKYRAELARKLLERLGVQVG